jgi:hypothetical protein
VEKYTSESKSSFAHPKGRPTLAKGSSEFKEAALADSSFTRAYSRLERFQQGAKKMYETTQKASYRDTTNFFQVCSITTGKAVDADAQASLVKTYPKPGTAFTHNAPTKHQFGDNKLNVPEPPKVGPWAPFPILIALLDPSKASSRVA